MDLTTDLTITPVVQYAVSSQRIFNVITGHVYAC